MTRCKNGVIGRRTDRRGMPTGEAPATPNRKVASTTLRCLTTDLLSGNGSCSIISVLESTITKSASRGSKGSLCTRTIVLRECEYGIERNRRIFCRIELAVPLVVDEFIVARNCDHGVGHTFSGHLAGEDPAGPKPVARIRRRSAFLRATARLLRHPEPYRQPLPRFSLSHLKADHSRRLLLQPGCTRAVCLNPPERATRQCLVGAFV